MITETTIYWILKLDDIRALLRGLVFLIFIFNAVSITIIGACVDWKTTKLREKVSKQVIVSCISIVLLIICKTFIPTTKQMLLIKTIPAVSNCKLVEEMSKDVKDFYKLGLNALKEKVLNTQSIVPSDKK